MAAATSWISTTATVANAAVEMSFQIFWEEPDM